MTDLLSPAPPETRRRGQHRRGSLRSRRTASPDEPEADEVDRPPQRPDLGGARRRERAALGGVLRPRGHRPVGAPRLGRSASAWPLLTWAHVFTFLDARVPLLVADPHGVRIRLGRTWRGHGLVGPRGGRAPAAARPAARRPAGAVPARPRRRARRCSAPAGRRHAQAHRAARTVRRSRCRWRSPPGCSAADGDLDAARWRRSPTAAARSSRWCAARPRSEPRRRGPDDEPDETRRSRTPTSSKSRPSDEPVPVDRRRRGGQPDARARCATSGPARPRRGRSATATGTLEATRSAEIPAIPQRRRRPSSSTTSPPRRSSTR